MVLTISTRSGAQRIQVDLRERARTTRRAVLTHGRTRALLPGPSSARSQKTVESHPPDTPDGAADMELVDDDDDDFDGDDGEAETADEGGDESTAEAQPGAHVTSVVSFRNA